MGKKIIAVTGPTACGKTRLAVELAEILNGEIISADSRQVYRNMDIGTGKDLSEYRNTPYHLIDICDAGEKYNLHRYLKDFNAALGKIERNSHTPILCGGTGLYLESALKGISMPDVPENQQLRKSLEGKNLQELTEILSGYRNLHNTTDSDTCKRAIRAIEIEEYYLNNPDASAKAFPKSESRLDSIIFALEISRELRRERITERLHKRMDEGMVDEIKTLIDSGIAPESLIYYGLEYKYVTLYVTGRISLDEMLSTLEIEIHKFAKRQMTWFRGMERRGFHLEWIPYNISGIELVEKFKLDSISLR